MKICRSFQATTGMFQLLLRVEVDCQDIAALSSFNCTVLMLSLQGSSHEIFTLLQ